MKTSRRKFILNTSLFTLGFLLNKNHWLFAQQGKSDTQTNETHPYSTSSVNNNFEDQFPYSLPKLPYAYNALDPFIDQKTMEIHHTKHHQGYVNNLNHALQNQSFKNAPLIELFKKVSTIDLSIRNNGGGHYNHTLFWQCLKPNPNNDINLPSKKLSDLLSKHFGSYENFKKEFSEKALKLFGSGWCWLIKDKSQQLKIVTTPNQDNPLMDIVPEKERGTPIFGIDVWEHAYYLKYQNKRIEYIENFWKILNWEFIEKRINQIK